MYQYKFAVTITKSVCKTKVSKIQDSIKTVSSVEISSGPALPPSTIVEISTDWIILAEEKYVPARANYGTFNLGIVYLNAFQVAQNNIPSVAYLSFKPFIFEQAHYWHSISSAAAYWDCNNNLHKI